jgi:hypothetical protein
MPIPSPRPRVTFLMSAALLAVILACAAAAYVALRHAAGQPSHEREWIEPQSVLPRVEWAGERVTIHGVRAFRWRSATDYDACWETRSYELHRLRRIWFGISQFGTRWRGPAHVFLSFEFEGSEFVAVSVEARREVGEEYGVLPGLLNRFEVIYVVGDERDVVGVRTHVWRDPVRLYPIAAPPERVREVFLALLGRAEQVRARPEFYHTIMHNCMSALVQAARRTGEHPLRYGLEVMLPGYADRRLQRLGLLPADASLAELRARWLVSPRAERFPLTDPAFSRRLREPADG